MCKVCVCILLPSLCYWPTQLGARVLNIEAGTDQISAAIASVASGDTLMLVTSGGVYSETQMVSLPALPLTILADPTLPAAPTWITKDTRHIRVYHDLVVSGIHFDGRNRTEFAIRSYAVRPNRIVIENCTIRSFTKDGVTDNDNPVDTCIIRNTVFHDIGETAVEFRTDDMCRNLIVENCTFYRIGERAIHIAEEHVLSTVRISQVTIHKSLGGIYLNNVSDAVVKNSIITESFTYAVRSLRPAKLVFITTFQNGINFDEHPGGAGCFNADPLYYNADAGDFSLLPASPCLTGGETGGALGDLRWTGQATRSAGRRRIIWLGGQITGLLILLGGGGYASVKYIQKRAQIKAEQNYLQQLSNRTIQTLEDERKRLSRELHDQLGQDLVTVSIQVEMLRNRIKSAGFELDSDFEELAASVTEAIGNVREISYGLRPVMLDDLGLIPTLQWYSDTFFKRTGLQVCLDLEDMDIALSGAIHVALYRIVQEALSNISKHAQATQVQIGGAVRDGWITVKIEDNGVGFDVESISGSSTAGNGLGLIHMQERVKNLQGTFQVVSRPGSGTCLVVRLPLPEGKTDHG